MFDPQASLIIKNNCALMTCHINLRVPCFVVSDSYDQVISGIKKKKGTIFARKDLRTLFLYFVLRDSRILIEKTRMQKSDECTIFQLLTKILEFSAVQWNRPPCTEISVR